MTSEVPISAKALFASLEGFIHPQYALSAETLVSEGQLSFRFAEGGGAIESAPAPLDWPDWLPGFGVLEALVENGESPLTVSLILSGTCRSLQEVFKLLPGEVRKLRLNLEELPLASDPDAPMQCTGVGFASSNAGLLKLKSLQLIPTPLARPKNLVDAFGQRIRGQWEGKVTAVSELVARRQSESQILAKVQPAYPQSPFGGWTGGVRFKPSGHFKLGRTQGGRWWLIDPEGYPFWSLGAACTDPSAPRYRTSVTGREWLFSELPPVSGNDRASVRTPHSFAPYLHTVYRKFGRLEDWQLMLPKRFAAWGLNTRITSFPDDLQTSNPATVRTLPLVLDGFQEVCHGVPDPFDSRWQKAYTAYCQQHLHTSLNDPALLGYSLDGRLAWEDLRLLNAEESSPLKQAWVDFMRQRYQDNLSNFVQIWQIQPSRWQDLAALNENDTPKGNPKVTADKTAFRLHFAEQLLQHARSAVEQIDSTHLFLGCPFGPSMPDPALIELAGRHCDVLLFSAPDEIPATRDLEKIHQLAGRPIILCDFSPDPNDERFLHASKNVTGLPPSSSDRRYRSLQAIKHCTSLPFILGLHFATLTDTPISGSLLSATKSPNILRGFLDCTDTPYEDLTNACREAASQIFKWRLQHPA